MASKLTKLYKSMYWDNDTMKTGIQGFLHCSHGGMEIRQLQTPEFTTPTTGSRLNFY